MSEPETNHSPAPSVKSQKEKANELRSLQVLRRKRFDSADRINPASFLSFV